MKKREGRQGEKKKEGRQVFFSALSFKNPQIFGDLKN